MQLSTRSMGDTYSLGLENAAKNMTHFKCEVYKNLTPRDDYTDEWCRKQKHSKYKVCKNLRPRDDYTKSQWGHRNNTK